MKNNKQAKKPKLKRMPGGVWADANDKTDQAALAEIAAERKLAGRRSKLRLSRDESTTAHCCTIYPFGLHSGLGYEGAYLGQDQLGGGEAFFYDPFVCYSNYAHLGASNTNMMILGKPGLGKSALVKTLVARLATVYGDRRFFAILDVKGEYTTLARLVGMPVVKLTAGGGVRINPLEKRAGVETVDQVDQQVKFVSALLATVIGRDLNGVEQTLVWDSVETVGRYRNQATMADLVAVLSNPSAAAVERARVEPEAVLDQSRDLVVALDKLLHRDLRGMFDGHSTVRINADEGQGVVLDISGANENEEILPLVMTASTAWLQQLVIGSTRLTILLLDEFWRMVAQEATARFLQSAWKLGRTFGCANIAVLHKPSDLGAQADSGKAASKIAEGLVADTSIRVSFAQTSEDLRRYGKLLGFGNAEQEVIARLGRGKSLWKIGDHAVLLRHVLAPNGTDDALVNTDQAFEAALT